jgi:hypothetical protein
MKVKRVGPNHICTVYSLQRLKRNEFHSVCWFAACQTRDGSQESKLVAGFSEFLVTEVSVNRGGLLMGGN